LDGQGYPLTETLPNGPDFGSEETEFGSVETEFVDKRLGGFLH
jgi:hypothetical protein